MFHLLHMAAITGALLLHFPPLSRYSLLNYIIITNINQSITEELIEAINWGLGAIRLKNATVEREQRGSLKEKLLELHWCCKEFQFLFFFYALPLCYEDSNLVVAF